MKKFIRNIIRRLSKWAWKVRYPIHIYQRIKYGVSFVDSWGLADHTLSVLKFGLERMSRGTCGFPHDVSYEKWQSMIKDMLFFVTIDYNNQDASNDSVWVTPSDKIRDEWRKLKRNVLNKKDTKKYYRGRKYLLTYFYHLWD